MTIEKGLTDRTKVIGASGLTQEQVIKQFEELSKLAEQKKMQMH